MSTPSTCTRGDDLSAPDAPPRAVFVDPTGRRHRLVARTCWALGVLGVAYVALVVVSLLLPPGLSRLAVPGLGPVLPGPAAAPLGAAEADGEVRAPDVLLAPSPSRSAAPRPTTPTPRPSGTASARPSPPPGPAQTSGPAPAPRPTPSARPASAAPAPASPSPRGAAPASPPGQEPSSQPSRASAAPATPPGQQPSRSPRPRPTPTRSPR